jgi:type 1 fimbria pilin
MISIRSTLRRVGIIVALIVTSVLSGPIKAVHADVKSTSAKFHGTLLVVECTVNANKSQTVDFGDAVGIHKVDGKRYIQPVSFNVSCQNYAGGAMPAMNLTIEGTATTFDNAAVETTVKGLGIELQVNGQAQALNQSIKFDVNNAPVLSAVPVKEPNTELEAKPFTATVKLRVDVV